MFEIVTKINIAVFYFLIISLSSHKIRILMLFDKKESVDVVSWWRKEKQRY